MSVLSILFRNSVCFCSPDSEIYLLVYSELGLDLIKMLCNCQVSDLGYAQIMGRKEVYSNIVMMVQAYIYSDCKECYEK